MKILQVIPSLQVAGAEIMCENLCYELTTSHHEILVVSLYNTHSPITDRMLKNDIDLRFLDKKRGFDFSCAKKLRKIVKEFNPDVIHTHLYSLKYAVLARNKVPIVHTMHSIASKETTKFQQLINKRFYKKRIVLPVALSEEIKRTFNETYRIANLDIPIVLNGVNLSKCIAKEDYRVEGTYHILHIGRFAEAKNHIELLKAIRILKNDGIDIHLSLIGEGELKRTVLEFISNNDLEQEVSLLGIKENVYPYLHDADIFVLPSLFEGVPMTIIEAMGTGLPIVASNVGGIPNLIDDRKEGLLCNPEGNSIASSIEEFIKNEELRENCGKGAKKKSTFFSSRAMCDSYIKVYKEALYRNGKHQ
ncbi:MAG TPA: glycosyltransferase [Fervidobacterium sp.]|nr:glycosyltransferase [Fervidobacterium sp.]